MVRKNVRLVDSGGGLFPNLARARTALQWFGQAHLGVPKVSYNGPNY
jgi:hypothetical protein